MSGSPMAERRGFFVPEAAARFSSPHRLGRDDLQCIQLRRTQPVAFTEHLP